MTSEQKFQIGKSVRIIGPDEYEDKSKIGKDFIISELRVANFGKFKGIILVSAPCMPWYPESSLELIAELDIGDEVEIIGRTIHEANDQHGLRFIIDEDNMIDGKIVYSGKDPAISWYPASSLRKISTQLESTPELKRAVGKAVNEFLIDEIKKIGDRLGQHDEEIKGIYDILSVHEDVHERIDQKLTDQKAAQDKLRKRCNDLEAEHQALTSYVIQQDDFRKKQCDVLEKRVFFLEAWQKDHMTTAQPEIRFSPNFLRMLHEESSVISNILDDIVVINSGHEVSRELYDRMTDEPELRKGDWVKIVAPDYRGGKKEIGEYFKIESFDVDLGWYSAGGMGFYQAASLHKLSDAEICKRLNGGKV